MRNLEKLPLETVEHLCRTLSNTSQLAQVGLIMDVRNRHDRSSVCVGRILALASRILALASLVTKSVGNLPSPLLKRLAPSQGEIPRLNYKC